MIKNAKIIIAVVAVIVVIALFAGIWLTHRPETSAGAKTITVEVVHKDESTKTFTYRTDAEYLGEVLLAEGLVKGDQGEFGLYVTEVDGEVADYAIDGGWWSLYRNGETTVTGVDTTPINDGESFSLVYTIG